MPAHVQQRLPTRRLHGGIRRGAVVVDGSEPPLRQRLNRDVEPTSPELP